MQVDNDTTIVVADEVTRVLHQEPGTPFVTGGFDSSAMASPEARSDQSRGPVHVHSMDPRLRDGRAMASQDRGVGAGMILSPQRESSSQRESRWEGEHMDCKP